MKKYEPLTENPKVAEAMKETFKGGSITKKTRKRSPKKPPQKVSEALAATMQGGAIIKPKKRSPKKPPPKVGDALAASMQGGKLKYHDVVHKHLNNTLTGRGGRFDSAWAREKIHQVMSNYHPSLFQTYLSGKVRDIPQDRQYHSGGPIGPVRRNDVRPSVVDLGGSLRSITHSENGFLQSHDSTFYNNFELI
jgi:hypothetical protein